MTGRRLNRWPGLAWRAVARADRWLDRPAVEFWVCLVLIACEPLMRLGFARIIHWLTGTPILR